MTAQPPGVQGFGGLLALGQLGAGACIDDAVAEHRYGTVAHIADTLALHGEQMGVNNQQIDVLRHSGLPDGGKAQDARGPETMQ